MTVRHCMEKPSIVVMLLRCQSISRDTPASRCLCMRVIPDVEEPSFALILVQQSDYNGKKAAQ